MMYERRQLVVICAMSALMVPMIAIISTHGYNDLPDITLPYLVFVLMSYLGLFWWGRASKEEAAQRDDEICRHLLSRHYKRIGVSHPGLREGKPLTGRQRHDMEVVISMEKFR